MKIVPPIVLKFLYHLIHSIYTLYEFILDLITVIRCHFKFKSIPGFNHHQVNAIDQLKDNGRIPSSISLVVSRKELDNFDSLVNKLGQLVHWSAALKIQHISIFDETGLLVRRRQKVVTAISNLTLAGKSSDGFMKILIKNGRTEPYYTIQVPNYADCTLRFLSDVDGRSHLIKIARKLCHRYSSKGLSSDDVFNESAGETNIDRQKPLVTLDMMCDAIKTEYNFPDPELIIRTSATASIFGFSPWQLRLSEIVFLPDHPSLPYVSKIIPSIESRLLFRDFVDSIAKFSSCEQRFGK